VKKIVLGMILAIFSLSVGMGIFLWDHYANQKNPGSPEEVVFEVRQGQGFVKIVKELEQKNLIQNAQIFSLYAKIKGEAGKMKVGEYALRGDMYPSEVLAVINSGKSIGRTFTIPEGMSIYEISELWEHDGFGSKSEFMNIVRDRKLIQTLLGEEHESLEGYLFPETYKITKYTESKQVVTTMVKKFMEVWAEIEPLVRESGQNSNLSRHQIVTLASIVEKETGAPEERPLISSVFHNRLRKGMLLQTDPTVIYGKAEKLGKIIANIKREDLTTPTRYNTYTIRGLPPGPIANPSREALIASIKPAESEYLFFVSKNEGRHTFSKDYRAHLAAVKKFQLDPKAREGKSWRHMEKSAIHQ
jgi:UPF0755 protein